MVRLGEALHAAEECDRNSRSAEEFEARGMAAFEARDYDGAINHFGEAIKLNPTSAKLHAERGLLYSATEQQDRAIEDFSGEVCASIRCSPQRLPIEVSHMRGNENQSAQSKITTRPYVSGKPMQIP